MLFPAMNGKDKRMWKSDYFSSTSLKRLMQKNFKVLFAIFIQYFYNEMNILRI